MSISFHIDEDELRRAAEAAVRQWAKDHQPKMDRLAEELKGLPVDEIKPIVKKKMTSWGGNFSGDDEVTRVAAAISQGERVILDPPAS